MVVLDDHEQQGARNKHQETNLLSTTISPSDERAKKLNLFRMLPVSSGVFAGGCGTKMPYMQARALIHVLQDKDVKEAVDGRELVLCFYDQKAGTQELLAYKKAMENDGQEPAETQTTGTDPAAPTDGAPAPTEGRLIGEGDKWAD